MDDAQTLLARASDVAAGLGYDHLGMYCGRLSFVAPATRRFKFRVLHNYEGELRMYCQSSGFVERDPVLRHCMQSMLPLAWGQELYVRAGAETLWSAMASGGLRAGMAFGIPLGSYARLGLILGARECTSDPDSVQASLGLATLMASYAITALERLGLFDPDDGPDEVDRLSRRETEVLRLASEGMTEAEIAGLLGISPNTVSKQLTSAAGRLRCHSRMEAIVRANSLGLL